MCPCGSLYAPLTDFQLPCDRLDVRERLGPREARLEFRLVVGDSVSGEVLTNGDY